MKAYWFVLGMVGCAGGGPDGVADGKATEATEATELTEGTDPECESGDAVCAGGSLQTCGGDGTFGAPVDCGLPGCNVDGDACNDCVPDDVVCDGDDRVVCGSDGQVASTLPCVISCVDADGVGGVAAVCESPCVNNEDCDDENACTADSCSPDPLSGELTCLWIADPDAKPDDGLGCTVDSCQGTVAVHLPDAAACNDSVACTDDSCVPGAIGADDDGCVHVAVDATCDDGVACTAESCDPDAGCVVVKDDGACGDGVGCTVDRCDPDGPGAGLDGCAHDPDHEACDDGASCSDEACDPDGTGADSLTGCVVTPVASRCDDGASCSADSCDPEANPTATGCESVPDHGLCGDGIDCTTDSCAPASSSLASGCVSTGVDGACADPYDCTVDVCDPDEGCLNDEDDELCGDDEVCFEGCHGAPVITSVFPTEILASEPAELTIEGSGFEAGTVVELGGEAVGCDLSGAPGTIVCALPAGGDAGPLALKLVNPGGLSATPTPGLSRWTLAEGAGQVGFCNVQFPKDAVTVGPGEAVSTYGQVYVSGETDVFTQRVLEIDARVGWSVADPAGDDLDPSASNSWSWASAGASPDYNYALNNDEVAADLSYASVGVRRFAYRFSRDGGLSWTLCDTDDGNGGFDAAATGEIEVVSP
jgi:hypothetical protein